MTRKQIAIVGWGVGPNSFGVTIPYLDYFSQFGDVHILTPTKNERIWPIDLLVLPGGADVNPRRYGAIPSYWTGASNPILEDFDERMLPKYIEAGIPVFGICRGLQSLGVFFGGKLDQEISYWHSSNPSNDRTKETHGICTIEAFEKNGHSPKLIQKVNSMHHQAFDTTEPFPEDLKVTAISDDGLFVEAFQHKTLPIAGVNIERHYYVNSN